MHSCCCCWVGAELGADLLEQKIAACSCYGAAAGKRLLLQLLAIELVMAVFDSVSMKQHVQYFSCYGFKFDVAVATITKSIENGSIYSKVSNAAAATHCVTASCDYVPTKVGSDAAVIRAATLEKLLLVNIWMMKLTTKSAWLLLIGFVRAAAIRPPV